MIPQNVGGFGKVSEARDAYYDTEIVPITRRMLRTNNGFSAPVLAIVD